MFKATSYFTKPPLSALSVLSSDYHNYKISVNQFNQCFLCSNKLEIG
jgi:hypothetical protein